MPKRVKKPFDEVGVGVFLGAKRAVKFFAEKPSENCSAVVEAEQFFRGKGSGNGKKEDRLIFAGNGI